MAEIIRKFIDESSLYAIWKITESADELYGAIVLKPGEEELYRSFVAESRKKQWLAYRILIRKLLEPKDFPVEYDEVGKPFLAGSHYHISVSHTGDLAAVILSSKGKVGIDLEKIRPRIENVKDKFMNGYELDRLIQGHELEQMTLTWCAKEALYKLYGIRTLDFRQHMTVEVPASAGTNFKARIKFGEKQDDYVLHSDLEGDCVLVYLME